MKLIFNADDFGYSRGSNFGTIDSFKFGVISQATIMANQKGFEHAVSLAKENPDLSLGVHLVLTCGKPLVHTHKTIVDEEGKFLSLKTLVDRVDDIDLVEVEREWEAQIDKVLATGVAIYSLDTHHLINEYGELNGVFNHLAKKYNLAVRFGRKPHEKGLVTTDDFTKVFYGDGATLENLLNYLESRMNEDVTIEIMTHPAYLDTDICNGSSYTLARVREAEILTSCELVRFIEENNIQVTNFKEITK